MKKYILLLIVPLLSFGQSNDCSNLVTFGDINICLPNILGMTECNSDPLVKLTSDLLKGSNEEVTLGFYLPDDIYKSSTRYYDFYENGFGEKYIKIYSLETLKGKTADESILDYLSSSVKSMFDDYEGSLKSIIDSKASDLLIDVTFDNPILLEEYQPSPKIKSFLTLMHFAAEGESYISTVVMNIILIKNRILFFAYYDDYKGGSHINKVKQANDYFGLRLLQNN